MKPLGVVERENIVVDGNAVVEREYIVGNGNANIDRERENSDAFGACLCVILSKLRSLGAYLGSCSAHICTKILHLVHC